MVMIEMEEQAEEQYLTPNTIGERAQAQIAAAVMEYGYTILIPFGEGRRYDMVMEKDNHFYRLQCKAGRYKDGVVVFNTCSVHWWARTKRSYTKEEIDFFAVYCRFTGKSYLVPVEDVGTTLGSLRVEPTANNQQKGVRWAEDYEVGKMLLMLQ